MPVPPLHPDRISRVEVPGRPLQALDDFDVNALSFAFTVHKLECMRFSIIPTIVLVLLSAVLKAGEVQVFPVLADYS
jgi:hypothetical protein